MLEQIHYLQACDKVTRHLSASTHTAIVAITGSEDLTSGRFRQTQLVERMLLEHTGPDLSDRPGAHYGVG